MDKKNFAKKYLISLALLFAVGAIIIFLLLIALRTKSNTLSDFSTVRIVLLSLGCACFPTGSFTGLVWWATRLKPIEKYRKPILLLLVVFFPIFLAILTIFGIIMIIPTIIRSMITLKRG